MHTVTAAHVHSATNRWLVVSRDDGPGAGSGTLPPLSLGPHTVSDTLVHGCTTTELLPLQELHGAQSVSAHPSGCDALDPHGVAA